jgi:hypothetical protein
VTNLAGDGLSGGCAVQRSPKAGGGAATDVARDPSGSCRDLATDGTFAYWAYVREQNNNGGNNGGNTYEQGYALGRVPLAGGAIQTVSLQRDDLYGARRVEADSTYVYAFDVQYLLRVTTSEAFSPGH